MRDGFQLQPQKITHQIVADLPKDGWTLSTYVELYAATDEQGIVNYDTVDRAVIVFVGPRHEAQLAANAIRRALPPGQKTT